MTCEGAAEVNAATGKKKCISKWVRDADFAKIEVPQLLEQAAQPLPGGATFPLLTDTLSPPHAPGAEQEQDIVAVGHVLERIDRARTRKTSKEVVREAQAEAVAREKSPRLQFTDEERATPELEKYIRKSGKAADRLNVARAVIPKEKKLVQERTSNEATGKDRTHPRLEEREKPIGKNKPHNNPLSCPAQEAGTFVRNKIRSVGKDNSGVERAHKSEELAGCDAKYGVRKVGEGYHSHKLKPYRTAVRAEKAVFEANADFWYRKALYDSPQVVSSPFSRFMQKQQIKRQYTKAAKKGGAVTIKKAAGNIRKAAEKIAEEIKRATALVGRHPAGVRIAVVALLLSITVSAGLSSCGSMFSGLMDGVLGASCMSEDNDLVTAENGYAAKENGFQRQIDNIENIHSGYGEYRYDLDGVGYSPHELASYLTALLQTYTPQSAQVELNRVFAMQYTSTLTEEMEIRYRIETGTDPETGGTTTEEVPHEYHIPNVELTDKSISGIVEELLTPQQLEMYRVYLETNGNRPLILGDGSSDMGAPGDLSGMQFIDGTRPGNTVVVDLIKWQVDDVDG